MCSKTLFFRKCSFAQAKPHSATPRRAPKRPEIGQQRFQDDLKHYLFSSPLGLRFCFFRSRPSPPSSPSPSSPSSPPPSPPPPPPPHSSAWPWRPFRARAVPGLTTSLGYALAWVTEPGFLDPWARPGLHSPDSWIPGPWPGLQSPDSCIPGPGPEVTEPGFLVPWALLRLIIKFVRASGEAILVH